MRELEITLFAFVQSFVSLRYFLYHDHRLQILCRLQEVHVVAFAFKFREIATPLSQGPYFCTSQKAKAKVMLFRSGYGGT